MFGFLIGFLSLIGLIATLKRVRRRHGFGRGDCHGHHDHHGHRGRGRRGRRGGGWMRHFFRRLDTTPGQEKEIKAAVEEMTGRAKELRGEGRKTRNDVAALLRTETLDEEVLAGIFTRHDDQLREMQKVFSDGLSRVHQALDPEQRARLARMIESDERGPDFGGPYRGWV
ncbi:MAG: Spy/CpxP family protein refolding chaperone [Sandaracinaceae bacterium]